MDLLSINTIAFSVLDYPMSYVEVVATLFGLASVYLASKANILTWPTGIVNEIGFFIVFFQVQLYADMLLQVYFFIVTIYGWIYWRSKESNHKISTLETNSRLVTVLLIVIVTAFFGAFISNIHTFAPDLFKQPAAYPFIDAFTTVASIAAMLLMARKHVESWLLWICVDVVSIGLYYVKGIYLISIEYVVFLVIASFGFINWRKQIES